MNWYRRFLTTSRIHRIETDLDREFEFHINAKTEELMAGGINESEARRRARRQFGNLTLQKERSRDMYVFTWAETALRNLRIAFRSLLRTPLLSAGVVTTLALAIGANSAVFSIVDAVLIRPLAFPDGDRLMLISQQNPKNPSPYVSPDRLEDWSRMNSTFQAMTGYYTEDATETSGELPEKLTRAFVASRFLEVWQVAPALGRGFSAAEYRYGGPSAVLISDRLWRRRFNGDPAAIGKQLHLGTLAPVIVGVMPASFRFPDLDVDLWWPVPADSPVARNFRAATWYTVVGRLKPGVGIGKARADLNAVQSRLALQYPATDANLKIEIEPLKESIVGGVRRSLWIVFGSVSLLLLIACANVSALLLSRAVQRRPETSIRLSLGASRRSIIAQFLSETAILAIFGAALGLPLAAAAPRALHALDGNIPRLGELHLDWRLVAFSLVCVTAVTLLCGLVPAIRSTSRNAAISSIGSNRGAVSGRHSGHWLLVGVQVALAVILLSGAGLLVRSIRALGQVTPGFDPNRVLTFRMSGSYAETVNYTALTNRILRTLDFLRAIPGVEASATAVSLPGVPSPAMQSELQFTDGPTDPDTRIVADSRVVSDGYFNVMRIPLLAGELCPKESPSTAATSANTHNSNILVNRRFADIYLAGSSAIGRHLRGFANFPPGQIRGIVGDARERGLQHEPGPTVYWCVSAPEPSPYFLVRTKVDAAAMIPAIRRGLRNLEPQRAAFDFAPLMSRLDSAFSENRLRTILLVALGLAAVLLSSVGLFSSLSYLVTVRQKDVAVRLAVGALPQSVARQFLLEGVALTLIAGIAGLGLALGLTRLLTGYLYGVTPSDPATLAGVMLLVLSLGALASLVPALRAARLEPWAILREE